MRELNPYDLSYVLMAVWGAYSLAMVLILGRKGRPAPDLAVKLLLGAVWLAFAGLQLYVRIVGHAL